MEFLRAEQRPREGAVLALAVGGDRVLHEVVALEELGDVGRLQLQVLHGRAPVVKVAIAVTAAAAPEFAVRLAGGVDDPLAQLRGL